MVLGNFQCQVVLLIWITVGQGPTVLAVGAGASCGDFFFLSSIISLSPPVWGKARYKLKYCLKGSLNLKQLTDVGLGLLS